MDRFILKEVTEGKFLNRSLLFHIEDTLAKKHFEAVLNKVKSAQCGRTYNDPALLKTPSKNVNGAFKQI